MKFRFCEFLIEDEKYPKYCGMPAEKINTVPGYLFLCRKHHMVLDGRHNFLLDINKSRINRVNRICPYCKSNISLPLFRLRSRLNFCNHTCKGKFFYENNSGLRKNNEAKIKKARENNAGTDD